MNLERLSLEQACLVLETFGPPLRHRFLVKLPARRGEPSVSRIAMNRRANMSCPVNVLGELHSVISLE